MSLEALAKAGQNPIQNITPDSAYFLIAKNESILIKKILFFIS